MVQRMKWREGSEKELKLELVWRERNEEIDETWPVKEIAEHHLGEALGLHVGLAV
jgi:hypothetical protein